MITEARLKRHATVIAGQSPPSSEVGDRDEYELPFLQGNAEFTATTPVPVYGCDSARKRARRGDILLSVRAPVGALNIADQPYGIGRGLCAIRGTRADQRFLWWVLHHSVTNLQSRATGSTYEAVSVEDVANTLIPLPAMTEQRAIADYLDTETSRIDTLITKKRRMIELLDERRSGAVEAHIRDLAARYGESPLKFHVPAIVVGIVVTPAAFYAETGIPALRGVNVNPGLLDLTDMVYLSEEAHIMHLKSRLVRGDIVVVRTGQAGAACVIPKDMDGANCVDLLIVRRSSRLDPHYLEYVINSDWTIKHIEKHSVGSIQSHFNVESLKQLPVPVPPLVVQAQTAAELKRIVADLDTAMRKLDSQIKLLAERRQALITATVTGESSVPRSADPQRQPMAVS